MSHLKYLPIDKLKRDKSFVIDIDKNKEADVIVKSMISLDDNLELSVIADRLNMSSKKNLWRVTGVIMRRGVSIVNL